ncbi:MAG: response regulator receiver [Ferruginibacter sp.]|nr:response regulator receiver [Ferruginibacter sp.]
MSQRNRSILLADDDPEDLELLEEAILSIEPGAIVKHFYNGREVIDFLRECSDSELPCLIILDYNMPQMTGAELLTSLGDDNRYKTIPKMVLSTSNAEAHIKLCLKNGATDYFVKPFDMKELQKLAGKMLSVCNL